MFEPQKPRVFGNLQKQNSKIRILYKNKKCCHNRQYKYNLLESHVTMTNSIKNQQQNDIDCTSWKLRFFTLF